MPAARTDVAVVGAGLAGLCTALHLTQAGLEVTVLEAADEVGGRVRTDVVDGLRLDWGFQVYNTAYPEAARVLDHKALNLRAFEAGVRVRIGDRLHRLSHPLRRPQDLLATLRAPIGSPLDKVVLARLALRVVALPPARLLAATERTAYDAFRAQGLSVEVIDRLLRPFLSGVFLEDQLTTSSRFADLVLRSFALGRQAVPALGMREIPRQLAARLPERAMHLSVAARAVRAGAVEHDGGTLRAAAVVVATAAPAAARLLPGLPVPAMHGVTTLYHLADQAPLPDGMIVVDGDAAGPVVNTVVLSNAAATYADRGRVLVSSSVLGTSEEPVVRRHLSRLYGVDTSGWDHVATYDIADGVPDQRPPQGRLRRPVRLEAGLFVAGDHRDSGSIQGAMVSGRRAARAVLADLHGAQATPIKEQPA